MATAVPPVKFLNSRKVYWVAAVVAPARGWAGMAGCHRGSRYLLDTASFRPSRANYASFDSRADCLAWLMAHRTEIAMNAPGATIRPVSLSRWLLGLD